MNSIDIKEGNESCNQVINHKHLIYPNISNFLVKNP